MLENDIKSQKSISRSGKVFFQSILSNGKNWKTTDFYIWQTGYELEGTNFSKNFWNNVFKKYVLNKNLSMKTGMFWSIAEMFENIDW